MSRYRIILGTSGEFDLRVSVVLLDGTNEDIDTVHNCDSIGAARDWVHQQGGEIIGSQCSRCHHVQLTVWNSCERCGNPALIATSNDPMSDAAVRLSALRAELTTSVTHRDGTPDRKLDFRIESYFATGIHDDQLDANHGLARNLTTDLNHTLSFFAERLPGWLVEMNTDADAITALKHRQPPPKDGMSAGVTILPQAIHYSQDAVLDGGGHAARATSLSLALLDAIFQALIAKEG